MCTSSANFDRKYYTLLTPETLSGVLGQLSKKETGKSSYKIITGVKGAKLFDLAMLNMINPMPEDMYNLMYRAIQLGAYIHPGWDYYKFPHESSRTGYSGMTTNEVFELVDDYEDVYNSEVYIYVGRE